jgi:hypothetical protein
MLACLSVAVPSLAMRLYVVEELLVGLLLVVIPLGLITFVIVTAVLVQEGGRRLARWAKAAGSQFLKGDLKRRGVPAAIAHADLGSLKG